MPFRGEIEGLRGVAVVLAILFHLSKGSIPRGFLGVDVFFVISGYLITGILCRELEGDAFSLVDFYRRRAVRILPALLVMIVLVCAAAVLILLPPDIRTLANSAVAASTFVSNLYFWSGSSYFDNAQIKPLLHTWSLGVEEQFYLLYPLFLAVAWRWLRRRVALLLWGITLASLAVSWALSIDHVSAAFFLLPSRGWELGLGAVAAAGGLPHLRAFWLRGVVSGLGLAMLVAGTALHFGAIPAPGALPACVGTMLLLAYGEKTPGGWLLALPPLRWVGSISYPLYLWHYPLIELYKAWAVAKPGPTALMLLTVAMVIAAWLSHRFVETPIRLRFRSGGPSARVVFAGIGASVAVALAALGLAAAAPWVRPLPPDVARVVAFADYEGGPAFEAQFGPERCRSGTIRFDMEFCLPIDPARRNVLVLGDSHAAHLWRAVAERFPQDKVMLAASTGCRPLVGAAGARLCRDMFMRTMRQVIGKQRVQAVVLAAHWSRRDLPYLAATVREIRASGTPVMVIGPVVEYRAAEPRLAAMAMLRGDPELAARQRGTAAFEIDRAMHAIATAAGATYYSMIARECPGGACRLLTPGGVPYHFDDAHLTFDGARALIAELPRP